MKEPFFILSKKKVVEQYTVLSEFSDQISFSVKCNPLVAKILLEKTSSHLTCSFFELNLLNPLPGRTTIYLQSQSIEEIKNLLTKNYASFIVDNPEDLNRVLKATKLCNKEIELFLRMRLKEHSLHTEKHFVFGFRTEKLKQLIPTLNQNKFIRTLGLHVHRKTQNISEWSHFREINESLSEHLPYLTKINLGGGIPCRYKNFNFSEETLKSIFKRIKEIKKNFNKLGIKTILEPGRFIAGPSIKLITTITNIFNQNIVLNASVYNTLPDIVIMNLRPLIEEESEKGKRFTIKGCTPCSLDIFRYAAYLKNPNLGDRVTFLNAGAYNFYTEFCHLPKPKTKIIESFKSFEH
mgnify:CR=1 FL=1